jgi:hypothetical protein
LAIEQPCPRDYIDILRLELIVYRVTHRDMKIVEAILYKVRVYSSVTVRGQGVVCYRLALYIYYSFGNEVGHDCTLGFDALGYDL